MSLSQGELVCLGHGLTHDVACFRRGAGPSAPNSFHNRKQDSRHPIPLTAAMMSLSSIMRKTVASVKGLFSPEGNTARSAPAHGPPLQVKRDHLVSECEDEIFPFGKLVLLG